MLDIFAFIFPLIFKDVGDQTVYSLLLTCKKAEKLLTDSVFFLKVQSLPENIKKFHQLKILEVAILPGNLDLKHSFFLSRNSFKTDGPDSIDFIPHCSIVKNYSMINMPNLIFQRLCGPGKFQSVPLKPNLSNSPQFKDIQTISTNTQGCQTQLFSRTRPKQQLSHFPSNPSHFFMIQKLSIGNCRAIESFRPLQALNSLTHLTLYQSVREKDFSFLAVLPNLNFLSVRHFQALCNIEGIKYLSRLKTFSLSGSPFLKLDPLSNCSSTLVYLKLDLDYLEHVESLRTLTNLLSLDLYGCVKISDISPLAALINLEKLRVTSFFVEDLSSLASLNRLTHLELRSCSSISNLEPLKFLKRLQRLNLHGCYAVTDLLPLSQSIELQELDLSLCGKIQNGSFVIDGLIDLQNGLEKPVLQYLY